MAQQRVPFSQLCNFFDRQWLATEVADAHTYTLYGGRRGPGKSHWLRWYPIRRLLRWGAQGHRGVRVGMFCEDYPSLKDRQISKIAEFPSWLGVLKETKSEGLGFRLRAEYGGGVLALRNLDDPSKYQSTEFAGICIDELTKNGLHVFDQLRGSLRWPGIDDTFFIGATNPNGPGQVWVREYFVERNLPKELLPLHNQFAYVPAGAEDNPYIGQSYRDMLDTLPDKLRQAWRDGNWYVQMEGVVYEEFSSENLTHEEPDPALPIELGFDDGYVDPRAILFIQRKPTHVLVFGELYHTHHLGEMCVREALDVCASLGLPKPARAFGSPEAVELRKIFQNHGVECGGAPAPILEGINDVRRALLDSNGYRPLRINYRCRNLVKEISEGYQYPPGGSRMKVELPVDSNNHACDALRYWVRARLGGGVGAVQVARSPLAGYRG